MATFCGNSYRSSKHKDNVGKKILMCGITKQECVAQRFCTEKDDYIISERVDKTCRNYKRI